MCEYNLKMIKKSINEICYFWFLGNLCGNVFFELPPDLSGG